MKPLTDAQYALKAAVRRAVKLCGGPNAAAEIVRADAPRLSRYGNPDLNAELSKFIALSMASRIASYNPDMNFKVFCDRWLEFKLRRDPNWKPEPATVAVEAKPFVLVIENTLEASCWAQHNRERGLRPLFFCKQIKDGAEVVAARCDTLFPPGYDEATGERIQSAEDAA